VKIRQKTQFLHQNYGKPVKCRKYLCALSSSDAQKNKGVQVCPLKLGIAPCGAGDVER
jgi:hypothetical protein